MIDWLGALARWAHYFFGIMWIGLLYYFNFVQGQALAQANANNEGAGITKYVAPRALDFFRASAGATWVIGVLLLATLPPSPTGLDAFLLRPPFVGIGIGAWLGTIMMLNVMIVIYPNQMKILGKVPATDEQKAKARRAAFLASRLNTALSLPLLFFMAFGFSHKGVVGL